jgi:hypothetical protein
MTNERVRPAERTTNRTSPYGPAGNDTSTTQYFKITSSKTRKNNCICPTCNITQDFEIDYYCNTAILRDDDLLVHIPKVLK